mmetsp:Transcript_11120/g.12730  ORF Transcript_11120/g.12730 Transcript_11120/m.12730 type:complete len:456 (+) Transcript_11120:127-1494(+)
MVLENESARKEEAKDQTPEKHEKSEDSTVILFYKYVEVKNPDDQRAWQLEKMKRLSLTGRLRVAAEGINGSLFGTVSNIEAYKKEMHDSGTFAGIDWKHSVPHGGLDPFDGMQRIRISREITGTGPMSEFKPTALGGKGGIHLEPKEFGNIVKKSQESDDYVVIDTRNHYETVVGKFKGAVDPKLRCFAQFPHWLEANYDKIKGKKVGLYCTGGIRCEKASAYVKSLGIADEVYQLKGGIHSYLEEFSPNAGKEKGVYVDYAKAKVEQESKDDTAAEKCLYEGINFQFDNRFSRKEAGVGNDVSVGRCTYCFKSHSNIFDDARCQICTDFLLICDSCLEKQKSDGKGVDSNGNVIIYCPEHRLLGDDWKQFLNSLKWSPEKLESAKEALRKLRLVSDEKCRNGSKSQNRRKQNLQIQIDRIEAWQKENPSKPTEQCDSEPLSEKSFVPFVPFLNP